MDIYLAVTDYVSNLPVLQHWPEIKEIVARATTARPKYWELPLRACEAVGGASEQAIPAIAAIGCAQMSILLIDDMLDDDPRGEYLQVGHAKAANYAAALQAAALEAFYAGETQSRFRLLGLTNLTRMSLMTALGQHLDIQNPPDEAAYWHVVETKSAFFFGAALYLGALAGGASSRVARGLERFGHLYGCMIQIHDDLNDVMKTPANSDWLLGRSPLPILFAQTTDHPARARFRELCRDISKPGALTEAQDILIRCGAISYCVDQLLRRHRVMRKRLASLPLARRDVLDALTDELVVPVYRLFRETGIALPDPLTPDEYLVPA